MPRSGSAECGAAPRRPARARIAAARAVLACALAVPALGGCLWKYGFAGGGLPAHAKTVAVLPLENQTAAPELTRELTDALRAGIESRLGLRTAPEDKADVIVRGTIIRYEPDAPVAFSADPTRTTQVRRRLQIAIDIELFDQVTGKVLWSKKGLTAEGEYSDRSDTGGRKQAIDKIVQEVVDGAQSQW